MIELGIEKLGKAFDVTTIFENLDLDVYSKDRVGVVGSNGVGKSTLLKMICGLENITKGNIHKRKGLRIGYLEQIPDYDDELLLIDVLKLPFSEFYWAEKEIEILRNQMSSGKNLEKTIEKYNQMLLKLESFGDVHTKLNRIIVGLNFDDNLINNKFNSLSGGEKARVLLGKLLLEEPELLLLDEPSNHLDINSIEWLEKYINNYDGAVMIVSHDRYFLDKIADRIVEIRRSKCDVYKGNYSKYVVERELRLINEVRAYENQQKKVAKMQDQIKRYRIWGEMRDSDKMYRRAKELEKRLEKLDSVKKPVYDRKINSFSLESKERTGKIVVSCKDIDKRFDEKLIFSHVNFEIRFGESVAVLGANGIGKSTLLKIIIGEMSPNSGNCKLGSKVNVGYLSQNVHFSTENITLVDYFSGKYNITYGETRSELAKIMFTGDDVYKSISALSGGEKTRLRLLTLMYEKFNVLILDEPTNHLDIESREALESDLINYDGTIIFVSHDRYFIEKVATRIFHIEHKKLGIYNLGYNEYVDRIQKQEIEEKEKISNENSEYKNNYLESKQKARLKEKKIRDFKKLEEETDELDEYLKELEKKLYLEKNTSKLVEMNEEFENKTKLFDKKFAELEKMYEDTELADEI